MTAMLFLAMPLRFLPMVWLSWLAVLSAASPRFFGVHHDEHVVGPQRSKALDQVTVDSRRQLVNDASLEVALIPRLGHVDFSNKVNEVGHIVSSIPVLLQLHGPGCGHDLVLLQLLDDVIDVAHFNGGCL